MKVLLLYPKFPKTFWSFKYALYFIDKKAAFPPLGLLTVASLLPPGWEKKLIDLNVRSLDEKSIEWADFVFISAMDIQKESALEIIKKSRKMGKRVVVGGPLFTTNYEEFLGKVDCFILGEAETALPGFLSDLKKGILNNIYKCDSWPNINEIPIPSWDLIRIKDYASLCVQFSRGCPFNCEFCDIVILNGRVPRMKDKEKILIELEILYRKGWRGNVFFVDDNFIGNKAKLKNEVLPALIEWMKEKKYPFTFNTQVSVNLADDKELVEMMVRAGFTTVFVGIETPGEESLRGCGKMQNVNRNLLESVKFLQNCGLEVQAGFIVGFDQDTSTIFDRMIRFIQGSGITTAMVGLLQAPAKTRLWQRLKKEGRLTSQTSGDNTDCTMNFIPKMDQKSLITGYKKILNNIYSPKDYYNRLINFLKEYRPKKKRRYKPSFADFRTFWRAFWILGIREKERNYYWRLLFWGLFRRPKLLPALIEMAIKGFHLRKVSERYLH